MLVRTYGLRTGARGLFWRFFSAGTSDPVNPPPPPYLSLLTPLSAETNVARPGYNRPWQPVTAARCIRTVRKQVFPPCHGSCCLFTQQQADKPAMRFLPMLLVLAHSSCTPDSPASNTACPARPARYQPSRSPGSRGAVSAGHPLAAAAGLDVLNRGGNATDAALAMAGVLAVVRPNMNGAGGDAFALFYDGGSGTVSALNGSGRRAARQPDTPLFVEPGTPSPIPETGALSISVLRRGPLLPHSPPSLIPRCLLPTCWLPQSPTPTTAFRCLTG